MDAHTPYTGREAQLRSAWVSKARCRSIDPDDLFVSGAAQKRATQFCRECPVARECLADALDHHMEWGIWGGLTERQRRVLLREHPEVVSWSEFFAARRRHHNTGYPA